MSAANAPRNSWIAISRTKVKEPVSFISRVHLRKQEGFNLSGSMSLQITLK